MTSTPFVPVMRSSPPPRTIVAGLPKHVAARSAASAPRTQTATRKRTRVALTSLIRRSWQQLVRQQVVHGGRRLDLALLGEEGGELLPGGRVHVPVRLPGRGDQAGDGLLHLRAGQLGLEVG